MSKDPEEIPQVILDPSVQAQIDADPELAEAFKAFSEAARNAMQGVSDGRYKSFEDAIEAITGSRPEAISDDEVLPEGTREALDKARESNDLSDALAINVQVLSRKPTH